jgi:hypothetical protein
MQNSYPECRYIPTRLYGIIYQNTVVFVPWGHKIKECLDKLQAFEKHLVMNPAMHILYFNCVRGAAVNLWEEKVWKERSSAPYNATNTSAVRGPSTPSSAASASAFSCPPYCRWSVWLQCLRYNHAGDSPHTVTATIAFLSSVNL